MTDTPEQWAYDEAGRRCSKAGILSLAPLARMIQQYEPHLKPVDPDEAIAAEACAEIMKATAYNSGAYRQGTRFKIALRAIKLYKESVS